MLPVTVARQGGAAFLLVYCALLVLLGGPLLLLELGLGQFSSLPPLQLYRHLQPLQAGAGLAHCLMVG